MKEEIRQKQRVSTGGQYLPGDSHENQPVHIMFSGLDLPALKKRWENFTIYCFEKTDTDG
jgi:hypothetical protein